MSNRFFLAVKGKGEKSIDRRFRKTFKIKA